MLKDNAGRPAYLMTCSASFIWQGLEILISQRFLLPEVCPTGCTMHAYMAINSPQSSWWCCWHCFSCPLSSASSFSRVSFNAELPLQINSAHVAHNILPRTGLLIQIRNMSATQNER